MLREPLRRRRLIAFWIFQLLALFVFLASAPRIALGADHLGISFRPPDGDRLRKAIANLPEGEGLKIQQTASEVFPVFVFLPGIMGSRLVKQLPNGRQKLIWGLYNGVFASPDKDLEYAENDSVKAEVLDEYYALGRAFDIYGKAIDTIRYLDLSSGDNVRLFPYDWRQSNVKSAQDFSGWLCSIRSTLKGRPIVFIAHSMGGLILKYWLKNSYDTKGCADAEGSFSKWIRIKKLIFLGTPHYGAPKAVTAFADQYYLLVDPETGIQNLFASLDATLLSKDLNKFGATFPSAYELLPIVNTTDCFKDPALPHPLEVRQPNGSVHSEVDLFNPDFWKLLKWPRTLNDNDRAIFNKERLPKLLASAKAFLCGLSKYEPDDKFDVAGLFNALCFGLTERGDFSLFRSGSV